MEVTAAVLHPLRPTQVLRPRVLLHQTPSQAQAQASVSLRAVAILRRTVDITTVTRDLVMTNMEVTAAVLHPLRPTQVLRPRVLLHQTPSQAQAQASVSLRAVAILRRTVRENLTPLTLPKK